jgi:hypothetical protein
MADAGMKRAMLVDFPCASDPLGLLTLALVEVFFPCKRYFKS